ncbi:hypothetical protein Tco_1570814 [Tanacetum coccineum]
MVRLWWPQSARPPPQRWHQAAEHSEAPSRGCAATARHHMVRLCVVQEVRGGLDDDGGVVTMACKAGDDGGSVVVIMDSSEVASSE